VDFRYLVLINSGGKLRLDDFPGVPGPFALRAGESHACSPIFPVQPERATTKLIQPGVTIGFFCVPQAFCVIGAMSPGQRARLWFSLGLPSLLVFEHDRSAVDAIHADLGRTLRAFLIWEVLPDGSIKEVDSDRCTPEPVELAAFDLPLYGELPPDVCRDLWTVQCGLKESCRGSVARCSDLNDSLVVRFRQEPRSPLCVSGYYTPTS